jgi:hypothetical protein
MKAFPTPSNQIEQGLEARDYFAARALQAQLGIPEVYDALRHNKLTPEGIAEASYEWADYMMEARKK